MSTVLGQSNTGITNSNPVSSKNVCHVFLCCNAKFLVLRWLHRQLSKTSTTEENNRLESACRSKRTTNDSKLISRAWKTAQVRSKFLTENALFCISVHGYCSLPPSPCVTFSNICYPRPITKLQAYTLFPVLVCSLNIYAELSSTSPVSSTRNLKICHVVVTQPTCSKFKQCNSSHILKFLWRITILDRSLRYVIME